MDAARVKAGQKATLIFDAVPDLTITGQVIEVDAVGTVSQGVVTYFVKIGFDTQDERIKTAMSVSASIIIEVKMGVLLVSNSSVKQQSGEYYVEMPSAGDAPSARANPSGAEFSADVERRAVVPGLANDEFTEITAGLKEEELVVTRTIQPSADTSTQTASQNSGIRIPGISGGGNFRR